VGVDIRPLFHFWGVPPINSTSLSNSIRAANLPASSGIYDTLIRYKSLVPANNAEFRFFANNWWGRQPSPTGYTEEANHAARWDTYDEAFAAATASRAQQIINLYFPTGRPSDYLSWVGQWPGANLTNPNSDLDGDGLSNDYERIWGLNPTSALSRNPFRFNASLKSGTFSYTRRTPALTGLNYSVWTSTDLLNWTQDTGAIQNPGIAVNQVETVAVTLSPGLVAGPRLFIRMRTQ
jgi:hypothetical protein